MISQGSLYAHAYPVSVISTPTVPKLYDTLRIIDHPQGAEQALAYLASRSSQELSMMKTNALKKSLSILACPDLTMVKRQPHLVARSLKAIQVFLKMGELGVEGECLGELWKSTLTPTRMSYGHLPQDLIARSAAQALHQIGRVDLLIGALVHPDPQIRALAARSGIEPRRLCELYIDDWPEVRLGAIRGLVRVASTDALCLFHYLKDHNLSVRLQALEGIGRLSQITKSSYHPRDQSSMITEVRRIVRDSGALLSERHAALTTLALWGERQDASDLLKAHFERGGLLELSKSALYALVIADPASSLNEVKRAIRSSPSLVMRSYAARLLVDPRIKWDHLTSKADEDTRLTLLRHVIQELNHRGETRVAERLMTQYQKVKLQESGLSATTQTELLPELAPALSDEER